MSALRQVQFHPSGLRVPKTLNPKPQKGQVLWTVLPATLAGRSPPRLRHESSLKQAWSDLCKATVLEEKAWKGLLRVYGQLRSLGVFARLDWKA